MTPNIALAILVCIAGLVALLVLFWPEPKK